MPMQQSTTSTTTTTTTTITAPKSMAIAYVLWFFLGQLGIHRFYLGKTGTAVTQLILGVVGWILTVFLVGFIFLAVLWIWLIVDIFLIPGLVRSAQPVTMHQVSHTVVTDIPGASDTDASMGAPKDSAATTELLPPRNE